MYSKAFLSVLDICALSYLYILEMRNVTIIYQYQYVCLYYFTLHEKRPDGF